MGALNGPHVYDKSLVASADLSGKQGFAVKNHSVEGQMALCAAVTDVGAGILVDKPKSGETGRIRVLGQVKAVSDGSGTAIAVNDKVGPDANGRLVKVTT